MIESKELRKQTEKSKEDIINNIAFTELQIIEEAALKTSKKGQHVLKHNDFKIINYKDLENSPENHKKAYEKVVKILERKGFSVSKGLKFSGSRKEKGYVFLEISW